MAFERPPEVTDPKAMRALAHPVRMALLEELIHAGTLTATEAGERVGESPANASFHLRQLAKYGLVEEAPGGRGRERPWRATARFTSWSGVGAGPEMEAADQVLSSLVADRYREQFVGWLTERSQQPLEWQQAASYGDLAVYVTAEELERVGEQMRAVLEPFLARLDDAAARPEGSRLVTVIQLAFPTDAPDAR